MAVTLFIDVAAAESTPSGRLKDLDEINLAADRLSVVALEVAGEWHDLAAWTELGSPPITGPGGAGPGPGGRPHEQTGHRSGPGSAKCRREFRRSPLSRAEVRRYRTDVWRGAS